jgi:L-rhamnose-H+ transport protein
MIAPNLALGVGFHAVGAMLSANCYAPQKYVKRWSWEIFWMSQAAWCWLLLPIIGALATIPDFGAVVAEASKPRLALAFSFGILYGIGGTAFNVSIRYIGFSLTYAIAVGLSSILGTLVPPLVRGDLIRVLQNPGAGWLMAGVAAGAGGIALCGLAGHSKEKDLDAGGARGEFSLARGLVLSLVAGVFSAVYGFGLDVAAPVADIAERHGAGIWKGNVAYPFVNSGAFLTAFLYSLWLARRNRTLSELHTLPSSPESAGGVRRNHLLALATGALWYGQFFFYNLGHVRLAGDFSFSSWAIHMIMLVLFSNLVAVLFREWSATRAFTRSIIAAGLVVLCGAVLMLTYGNYIGAQAG